MRFAVEFDSIDPTPGKNELPEEIVENLKRHGAEIDIVPTGEEETTRDYLVNAIITANNGAEAETLLAAMFKHVPGFDLKQVEANEWTVDNEAAADSGAESGGGEVTLGKYLVTRRFGSNIPFEVIQTRAAEFADKTTATIKISGNGLVHAEFFARIAITAANEEQAQEAAGDILAEMLDADGDQADLNYRPITLQVETLI